MSLGLKGRKVGMMRIFTDAGDSLPVTVVDVSTNWVTQIKTPETDGYSSVQVGSGFKKRSRLTKSKVGHLAKAGVETVASLMEFPVGGEALACLQVGGKLSADIFSSGQKVDVTGVTLGKGFTGTIKRHNFRSQRASHGNSKSHNVPGSISMAQDPGRVFPGKKMAGHDGAVQRTVQNLEVVRVDAERGLLLIKGAVPGSKGGQVIVRPAVKA
ncbi:MAG: 50S ribosomal protein L3 [Burkholderiaceae bacterium]|jgi:large subunit ribosomal protein L3